MGAIRVVVHKAVPAVTPPDRVIVEMDRADAEALAEMYERLEGPYLLNGGVALQSSTASTDSLRMLRGTGNTNLVSLRDKLRNIGHTVSRELKRVP